MNVNSLISIPSSSQNSNEYKSIFDQQKNVKSNIDTQLNSNKVKRQKAQSERTSKISGNSVKSLIPVIGLQASNQLSQIYTQNSKLNDLVNKTNEFIKNAKTQDQINQAKVLRDTAINIINDNEKKILQMKDVLGKLSGFIQIFSLLINALSLIAIPTAVPPGVGIPLNIITGISKQMEKATKIVSGLAAILAIVVSVLTRLVNDLEELKKKLLQINDILEDKTTSTLTNDELNNFLSSLRVTQFEPYKGFTFALKEEQNPEFVVKGYKRHYAVAINSIGREVLKSEYSFTQDPNILIEQLKIQIDALDLVA